MPVPNKIKDRLIAGLKRFQPVLTSAKARDVNEADTVTIIADMLAEVFGYDKYSEITSEHVIRGTFVDLAIKIDGSIQLLIEAKAIGLELKEAFIKQAVDYGANQGVDWVVLTNGAQWQVYKLSFGKPISQELVLAIDFLSLNHKNISDLENLYLLTREGTGKAMLGEYHAQRQALSKYFIGATVLSEPVLDVIRRELRRISPDAKIDNEQIQTVLEQEVFKREIVEGEKAEEARRKVLRAANRPLRRTGKDEKDKVKDEQATQGPQPVTAEVPPSITPPAE